MNALLSINIKAAALLTAVVIFFSIYPLAQAQEDIPQLSTSEKWNKRLYYISMSFPIVRYAILFFLWLQGININRRDLIPFFGLRPYVREGLNAWRDTIQDAVSAIRRTV